MVQVRHISHSIRAVFLQICHFRAEEKRIKKDSSNGDGDEVFEKWNKWLRKKAEEALTALSKVERGMGIPSQIYQYY